MEPTDLVSRRAFTNTALGSLLTYSFLEHVFEQDAVPDKVKPITKKWLTAVNDLSNSIKGGKILQVDWQLAIERLFARVEMPELMKLIDFETLKKKARLPDRGERGMRFRLPRVDGLPTKYAFGRQVFGLEKGCSIPPHGHDNMTTAFLILEGDFRGRHWDRVEDGKDEIVIRQTIDKTFKPGGCSTISDYKDNVHWFTALSGPAFIFNIHVPRLRDDFRGGGGRVYLDPNGKKLANGLVRARRIGGREARRLYG